jgi:hypothetical protein
MTRPTEVQDAMRNSPREPGIGPRLRRLALRLATLSSALLLAACSASARPDGAAGRAGPEGTGADGRAGPADSGTFAPTRFYQSDAPPSNSPHHDEFCRPERYEGFVSTFACRADSDCIECGCRPMDRAEADRLGGHEYCNRFNQPPAREECTATNPACCDGVCVLSR